MPLLAPLEHLKPDDRNGAAPAGDRVVPDVDRAVLPVDHRGPSREGEDRAELDTERAPLDAETLRRFENVHRYRVLLSLMLLPPLAFFVFLVLWFREGFILIPIGAGIYLYMLAQFFIFQNPARRANRREAARDETQA